ncbi:MAG: DUF4388 domain-containing protein, partial [Candidatus Electrothrix sp. ATG2]|nr:DUF4388 domain-containing protein [Candidatus Electrothrix sp. ATG2]
VHFIFDECKGVVLFNGGEIVSCRCSEHEGKEAIFYILTKQDGQFTYSKGLSEEEKGLPVLGGFMGLVMEGLRRIDEEGEKG